MQYLFLVYPLVTIYLADAFSIKAKLFNEMFICILALFFLLRIFMLFRTLSTSLWFLFLNAMPPRTKKINFRFLQHRLITYLRLFNALPPPKKSYFLIHHCPIYKKKIIACI